MSVSIVSKGHSAGRQAEPARKRPLVWLNLVCLDAPLVAVAWQWLIARSLHVQVALAESGALFLTAWGIYLADRLADSVTLAVDKPASLRAKFGARHKFLLLGVLLLIIASDAALIWWHLDRHTIRAGIILGLTAVVYLVVNHRASYVWAKVPIKEVTIGFLFAGGTLLPLLPRAALSSLVFPAILFACLCSLNCISIAVWDRDLDRAQGKHSVATQWPRFGVWIPVWAALVTLGAIVLVSVDRDSGAVALCLGVSASLLGALHFAPLSRDERTALADLVLLTPLAVLLVDTIL
jgi:hypothetical protein